MAKITDIYCKNCESKAKTLRTEYIHSKYSKLYCSCLNQNCRHQFVINLEFSHIKSFKSIFNSDEENR
ncbi:ogr/Delta-like zinc finger family protein [Pasteurella multocida]|nr:ogr/Delta-like zinc finger family protein [Pasteurella multocida]HDR1874069.1 ogr/Delta-like zinc finger family protein [Pasteurella multocida]HDR1894429.1 ogr/Delta-like zinc finger family protein [Pasteurella multocida]HED4406674.1 ogr/Delta-like zinc finger family protein [Pasteurella multocida]